MIPQHLMPLAVLEKTRFKPKKFGRCVLSQTSIKTGDEVYAFKCKNFDDLKLIYVHVDVADSDAAFSENMRKFHTHTYSIEEMAMFHCPAYEEPLRKLICDYEEGLAFIKNPLD
jgi:hypothetical protein